MKMKSYQAIYSLDKKNTDKVSPKKITCDKIQTISVQVDGSPFYTEEFLKLLNTEKLNSLIVKL
jgi:hypothetical protein